MVPFGEPLFYKKLKSLLYLGKVVIYGMSQIYSWKPNQIILRYWQFAIYRNK